MDRSNTMFFHLRNNYIVISPIFVLLQTTVLVYFCILYAVSFTEVCIFRRVLGMFILCVVAVAEFPWGSLFSCIRYHCLFRTEAMSLTLKHFKHTNVYFSISFNLNVNNNIQHCNIIPAL
jgi:hypothetical protein